MAMFETLRTHTGTILRSASCARRRPRILAWDATVCAIVLILSYFVYFKWIPENRVHEYYKDAGVMVDYFHDPGHYQLFVMDGVHDLRLRDYRFYGADDVALEFYYFYHGPYAVRRMLFDTLRGESVKFRILMLTQKEIPPFDSWRSLLNRRADWPPIERRVPEWFEPDMTRLVTDSTRTRIVHWPGLVIELLIVAAALFLLVKAVEVGAIKLYRGRLHIRLYRGGLHIRERIRQRRIERGLCPDCRYPIRKSDSPGCPECGWNRPSVE